MRPGLLAAAHVIARPARSPTELGQLAGMSPDELVDQAEIAVLLGVTRRTVRRYMLRSDWPEPVGRLATGRIWAKTDIEAWGAQHLPLPRSGRPRKSPPTSPS